MTRPNHRPTVLPDSVEVRTSVPRDVAAAIAALAEASGVSKATFLRQVLLAGIQPYALVDPALASALRPTSYNRGA